MVRSEDGKYYGHFSSFGAFEYQQAYCTHYRREKIAAWTGQRGEDVVAADILEVAGVYGVGFAQPMRKRPNPGMKSMARGIRIVPTGIDMLDWVESDAAQHAGCLIAKPGSHPRVRSLMQAEREEKNCKLKQLNYDVLIHTGTGENKVARNADGSTRGQAICQSGQAVFVF